MGSADDKRGQAFVAGLDIGSVATKAVLLGPDAEVVSRSLVATGWDARSAAEAVLDATLRAAGLDRADLIGFGVTGYGRDLLAEAAFRATEVTCQARGVAVVCASARTILDIGGQDTKAIRLDEAGRVADFALNDRCAAGTGRFLEVMARALGMSLEELGAAAAEAMTDPLPISATCTVFAESEVVGLLARGEQRERIAAGLCRAVARQVVALARRVGFIPPVAVVGGVARNAGVIAALKTETGEEIIVPGEPEFTAALGVAMFTRGAVREKLGCDA
ncbi:MAG: acyl-CoA dehydratase activase [Armatimonadetes bacterium]|nr:acyl-CoA dehydratase activase [Armatimonadota bacterium]